MNLGELKNHIESFPKGTVFNYSLSDPFSWRGVYAEVAFRIEEEESTREKLIDKIQKAYKETFYGWKGGEFRYNEYTDVHFEESTGSYTDGGYTDKWISKVLDIEPAKSAEHRLVNLIFKAE